MWCFGFLVRSVRLHREGVKLVLVPPGISVECFEAVNTREAKLLQGDV